MFRMQSKKRLTVILSLLLSVCLFVGIGVMNIFSASAERGYWEEEYEEAISTPYWNRDIIYNELSLPFIDTSGFVSAKLQYTPLEVVSVKDQTLGITYEEGKDYFVDEANRQLIIPMRTSDIPVIAIDADTNPDNAPAGYKQVNSFNHVFLGYYVFDSDGDGDYSTGEQVVYTESSYFYSKYLSITYTYNRTEVDRDAMTRYDTTKLTTFRSKLEAGEDVDILVLGDSITAGCSATGGYLSGAASPAYFGNEKVLPGTPGYAEQVAAEIEKIYGVNVNLRNIAVGGALSSFSLTEYDLYNQRIGGAADFEAALNASTYDLCIIAFGMNDSGSTEYHDILKSSANPAGDITWPVDAFYQRNIGSIMRAVKGEIDIVPYGDEVTVNGVGYAKYYNAMDRATTAGRSPDCEFILINSYPRNTVYDSWGGASGVNSPANANNNFKKFKNVLGACVASYSPTSVVVDMYKVADSLLKTDLGVSKTNGRKVYAELSSTNFNHPNDYMHRLYAMNVVSAIYDYSDENFPLLYKANQLDEEGTSFTYHNELYDYAYGASGWAQYEQQLNDVVWVDNQGDVDIHHTYGYTSRTDYGNISQFGFNNSGWLINYLGYDIYNTIEFRYNVSAPGYTVGSTITGKTSYAFGFSASVLDALKSANHLYDASNKDNLSKLALWGANCDTSEFFSGNGFNLYGRLFVPQSGHTLEAINSSALYKYKTPEERATMYASSANPIADEGFLTVRINIGATSTTISIVRRYQKDESGNKYFAEELLATTQVNVTYADFPTGFAYLSVAVIDLDGKENTSSRGDAVVTIQDTRFTPKMVNQTTGVTFPAYYFADGWATIAPNAAGYYVNESGSPYVNYVGETVIHNNAGNFGFAVRNDGTLHAAGTHWNMRAFDVHDTININYTYTYSSDTSGAYNMWYALQLFDDIEAMTSDNLPWHDTFSLSKIHITGANFVRTGICNTAHGLHFFPYYNANGTPYAAISNVMSTAFTPTGVGNYEAHAWGKVVVNLSIKIGETSTIVTVNNNANQVVTLPVKRSDFAFGKAYLSLAVSREGTNDAHVLMYNMDRGSYITEATTGKSFVHAPDENGWDTYKQNPSANYVGMMGAQKVNSYYGVNTIYSGLYLNTDGATTGGIYGYSQIWYSNFGSSVNYTPLDVNESTVLAYSLTAPSVSGGIESWYAISFFDTVEEGLVAGQNTWDHRSSGAKLTILGGNGDIYQNFAGNSVVSQQGQFSNYLLINPYTDDLLIQHDYGFGTGQQWSNQFGIRIYIDEYKTRIYDMQTGAVHTINGLTRADFTDGKMYAHITMGNSLKTPADTYGASTLAFNIKLRQKYVPSYTETGYDTHAKYTGLTFEDGAHDAVNSTGVIPDGTNDTAFITVGSYVINKTVFDVTKEFEIKINVGSGGWENSQYGAWMVGMFERRQYMHDVGPEIWDVVNNGDKVKVLFGGSSSRADGTVPNTGAADEHFYLRNTIYPKTPEINSVGSINRLVSGFNYIGMDGFDANNYETGVRYVTVHVYIPSVDHIEQGYIKADGITILEGAEMGITQEDFVSNRVFLSFYSYGLTRWRVNVKQHEPTIVSVAANIASDVSMLYKVQLGTRYTNPTMDYQFTTSSLNKYTNVPYTMDAKGRYVFNANDINPIHMSVGMDVSIYAINEKGEKETIFAKTGYSIRDYAEEVLAEYAYSKNPELVTLMVDMLNLGAESQLFNYNKAKAQLVANGKFDDAKDVSLKAQYRINDLANKNIDAYQQYATQYVGPTGSVKSTSNDTYSVKGWQAEVFFNNQTGIHAQFQLNADVDTTGLNVRVFVDGVQTQQIALENLEYSYPGNSSRPVYDVYQFINATEFGKTIEFRMYRNDSYTGAALIYSVDSWIYAAANGNNANLAQALWAYGTSSVAYRNAVAGI